MPTDLRTRELAKIAVKYSTKVKKGETVIISGGSEAEDFIVELYKQVILAGAHPIIRMSPNNTADFFYKYANKEQLNRFPQYYFDMVKQADVLITVNSDFNKQELSSTDPEKISLRKKIMQPISNYIHIETNHKVRWVLVSYPCLNHAIEAEMSLTEWENFVYDSCLINWNTIKKRLNKIKSYFKEGSNVHLIGDGVDLKFKVHGKLAKIGDGEYNMPDGEIFMAPFRESVSGKIKFDYPSTSEAKEVSGIYLEFENGKVIKAKAEKNQDFLYSLLNTDENSSYVGEFGIGCNPNINRFTKELAFDEKMNATTHLALGMAYKDNGGGNNSAIHWDIVKDMKKAKMIVDGKVIQDKGKWKI